MANKYINGNGELGHTTFEVTTSCDTSDNVETFKLSLFVFIGNAVMYLTSQSVR